MDRFVGKGSADVRLEELEVGEDKSRKEGEGDSV